MSLGLEAPPQPDLAPPSAQPNALDAAGGPGPAPAAAPHMGLGVNQKRKTHGPSLNKRKREELIKRYKLRIKSAKKMRETKGLDATWRRMINLYTGKQWPGGIDDSDKIVVNIAFATINVIAPSVAVNYPKMVVNATDAGDVFRAKIAETVINYWWRHFDITQEARQAVKDFLIIGFGWVKCGYRFVQEEQPCEDSDIVEYEEDAAKQIDDYAQQNPDMAHLLPEQEQVSAGIPDTKIAVVEDRPFAVRVSPFDVYVDPEATNMANAKWIAQKIIRTVAEVQENSKYDPKIRKELDADAQLNREWLDNDRAERKIHDDIKRVTLWEFYDLHTNTMSVFAEAAEDFLVRPMWQPYAFGHPFEMLRNYEIPDEFYTLGELEALEPIQLELNKTRSQAITHRSRYAQKFLADAEALDDDARRALESDEVNSVIPVHRGQRALSDIIVPLEQGSVPPEFYQYSEQIQNDVDRISGVTEYQRGGMPEIRRTATEASIVQDAANARASDKLARVEQFYSKVSGKLLQLAQQYMTEPQVVRATLSNGKDIWPEVQREDIQGDFTYEVVAGSTQPNNDAVKRQQAMQMLQSFAPYAEGGVLDVTKLLDLALREGYDVKDPQEFFAAEPDPEAQKQQMAEEAILEAVKTIRYQDCPEDVQRQLEKLAGLEPSEEGGTSLIGQESSRAQSKLAQLGATHAREEDKDEREAAAKVVDADREDEKESREAARSFAERGLDDARDENARLQESFEAASGGDVDTTPAAPEGLPNLEALLAQLQGQVGLNL